MSGKALAAGSSPLLPPSYPLFSFPKQVAQILLRRYSSFRALAIEENYSSAIVSRLIALDDRVDQFAGRLSGKALAAGIPAQRTVG